MQPRIWVYSVVLAFSWLTSSVMAGETAKLPNQRAEKSVTAARANPVKSIAIDKAEFGVIRKEKSGKLTLIPTTKIPLQEGTAYGWRLQLKHYPTKKVTWREVLRLPKPPETWSTMDNENFSLSKDGAAAHTKRTDSMQNGVITNYWTITPGDPIGKHKIEIYIDDRHVTTFEFEIVSPLRQKKPSPTAYTNSL